MRIVEVEAKLRHLLGPHRVGLPYALLRGEKASVALFCATHVIDRVYPHFIVLGEVLCHHDELIAALVCEALTSVEVELVACGARAASPVPVHKMLGG